MVRGGAQWHEWPRYCLMGMQRLPRCEIWPIPYDQLQPKTHTAESARAANTAASLLASPERTVPYGAAIDYTLRWYGRHRPPCTCPTVLDRYIYPRGHPAGRSARRNVRYDIATALRRLHTSSPPTLILFAPP